MQTFPEVLNHRDVVVFPDDEDPNLFYCLRSTPRIRTINDEPVFRATFWTDNADGSAADTRGLKGGLINFDIDLSISEETFESIRNEIESSGLRERRQSQIERDERARLERLARARGESFNPRDVRVPELGAVRFGSIRAIDGKVSLRDGAQRRVRQMVFGQAASLP